MSCKIRLKKEHEKNENLSRSEKLVFAKVYDKNDNESKLWEDLKKVPFIKNLEDVENVFLNYYAKNFDNKAYVKYNQDGEPKLFYKSTKGNIFENYKEALVDSEQGNVEIGFVDLTDFDTFSDTLDIKSLENKNFESLISVNTTNNKNTVEGFVNNAIVNGMLSGNQIYNMQGEAMFEPAGFDNLKSFNGALFYGRAILNFDQDSITKDTLGNVRISDTAKVLSGVVNENGEVESLDETIEKVKKNGFESLVNETSPEQAVDIVVADYIKSNDFEKFFQGLPLMDKNNMSELRDKLFSVINKLGIQLTSIEEYKKNYKTKYDVEPDAKALADLANGIIALSEGATVEDLSEELSHFLVESMNEEELNTLLNDLYLTDSRMYQEESQKYREIYSKQGLTIDQLENKVRKEILGKLLSGNIVNSFKEQQSTNFIDTIRNFFNRIINRIRFSLKNPRLQIEIQDVLDKLTNEVLNEELDKSFSLENISEKYNGINPLYYSLSEDKVRILELKKAIEALENRLQMVKGSKIKDLNAYRNSIKRATDALANGHEWLTAKLVVTEAENLARQVSRNLDIYEKSKNDANLVGIKNDFDLLKYHIIPAVENLRNTIDNLELTKDFTEDQRNRILQQVSSAVAQQSENVSKYNRITKTTTTEMFEEIHRKYGCDEKMLPLVTAALTSKINDVSILYQWFGNPEHSSVPFLGMLAKILQDNELKKVSIIAPIAKSMEKFLDDNDWKQKNYHDVIAKNENGEFTYDMLNATNLEKAERALNDFETDLYNRLKFGKDTKNYVTSEEFKKGFRLNSKKEKTEKIELIDETDLDQFNEYQKEMMLWREQNQILQYQADVYRERNAVNTALGVSASTILFRNQASSDTASAMSKISDSENNLDPSKLDKDFEVLEDLADVKSRVRDAASPFDIYTGKTYFKISETEKETIEINWEKADGTKVTTVYDIPKIVFSDSYEHFNNDKSTFNKEASPELKLAYDLTRINLLNKEKYGNDSRTINDKFDNEISNIENFYAVEKGFSSYNEAKNRATVKELNELNTDINKALRKFTEVIGGMSFNEDFYNDLSAMSEGLTRIEKLDTVINDDNVSDYIKDKAVSAKELLSRRAEIFKKYKSRFNPAEIEVSLIPSQILDDLQRIDETIDSLFNDLRGQLPESDNSLNGESIASYTLNEAFEKDWKQSGLSRVEFMLLHVKNSSSFTHIKSDFKNFDKNGVKSTFKTFLGINGYLNKDGSVNNDYINAIKNNAGLEKVVSDYLSSRVYSYYKRFTPNGYGDFINGLNEGVYLKNGTNTSFGEFLRNMVKRQNGEHYELGNTVENYFRINPALQYSDGATQSFKEQLNPLYNTEFKDGRIQWNLDKFGDSEFFNRFGINFEEFKNNPLKQENILQEASKNNKQLEFILKIRDMNRTALEMYGETRNFSSYRIGRRRMTASESIRNADKPIDRVKGWYNSIFKPDVDTMDEGAMNEEGEVINRDLKIIPKFGLYDLADMKDMSTDIYHNTLTLLNGAINYRIKKDNLSDVLKLQSGLEQAQFVDGKQGKDSNAFKMFEEFVDAQYFGIMRNKKYMISLMGKKVDLTRAVSAVDRYVRSVNTAWSLAVAVTGMSSFNMFGLTEALTKEYFSSGAFSFGFSETARNFGDYTKDIGKLDRDNKSYLTVRLLGVESFDPLHNASASGRSTFERMMKHPGHKITEIFTNHSGIQVANAMLYDTRFYDGKWYSYDAYRRDGLINNKSKKDIDNEWKSLKDNSLYFNYGFSENNDALEVNEKGLSMMRDYFTNKVNNEIAESGQTLTSEQVTEKINEQINKANEFVFSNLSGRVNSLHSFLEGRVRQEQASSATRNAFFNPLLAHRGWFSNILQKKFKNGHFNFISGQYERGSLNSLAVVANPVSTALKMYKNGEAGKEYATTMYNSIMNPRLSGKQQDLYDRIKEMNGEEIADNMAKVMLNTNSLSAKRTGVETVLLTALLMFGAMIAGYVDDPDKKDDFATQYMGYLYFRLVSEYGSSNIITGIPQTVDMVNRPAIMFNLLKEVVNENNWTFDPVQSGAFQGIPKNVAAVMKQTSLRQAFDFVDITKKSQSYRFHNSASLGFGYLSKTKQEEE